VTDTVPSSDGPSAPTAPTGGVVCPACGTLSYQNIERTADGFCRECDFPLFWAGGTALGAGVGGADDGGGSRRYPGLVGRAAPVSVMPCPACAEQNPVSGIYCLRCGAELYPRPASVVAPPPPPAPAPPPPPPPPPEPVPEPRRIWPWVVAAITAVLLIALIISLALWG
jgi:hypothetical protein